MSNSHLRMHLGNRDQIHIDLIGPLRIRLAASNTNHAQAEVIERFRTRATASLLGYLATRPGRSVARTTLIDMFWPEQSSASGRNSLSLSLSSLRRVLEPEEAGFTPGSVIGADRNAVTLLRERISTDLAEFERLTARLSEEEHVRHGVRATPEEREADLSRAALLCRGPFLEGIDDEWVYGTRQQVQEQMVTLLLELAHLRLDRGENAAAADTARLAIEVEPRREETHREWMRLLIAAEKPELAVQQYHALRHLLRQAHRVGNVESMEPEAESVALFQQAKTAVNTAIPARGHRVLPTPESIPPPPPSLIGRDQELGAIVEWLSASEENTRRERNELRTVILTGGLGVGKTALARAVAHSLHQRGQIGAAWQLPSATQDTGGASGVINRLRGALEHLSNASPVLLALEDHPASELLPLIAALQRLPGPLYLLVTIRTIAEEHIPVNSARLWHLEPLSMDVPADKAGVESSAVRLLAGETSWLKKTEQAALIEIARLLEANPLALTLAAQWVPVLQPTGLLPYLQNQPLDTLVLRFDVADTDGSPCPNPPSRSVGLREALQAAEEELTPALQRIWQAMAVFAATNTAGIFARDAAAVLAKEGETVSSIAAHTEALERLAALGLIVGMPGLNEADLPRYRLSVPIRAFLTERTPRGIRHECALQHIRWRLARLPELLTAPDMLLSEAAEDAAAFAYCGMNETDREVRILGLKLAQTRIPVWRYIPRLGEPSLSGLTALLQKAECAELPDPDALQIDATLAAMDLAQGLNQRHRAVSFAESVLGQASTCQDLGRMGAAMIVLAGVTGYDHDPSVWRDQMERAIALCRKGAGDPIRLAAALDAVGRQLGQHGGDIPRGFAYLCESLALYRDNGDSLGQNIVLAEIGFLHYLAGRYGAAADYFGEALELARRRGDPGVLAGSLWHRGNVAIFQGHYGEADAALGECLLIRRRLGLPLVIADTLQSLSILEEAVGDTERARWFLEECEKQRQTGNAPVEDKISTFLRLSSLAIWDKNFPVARENLRRAKILMNSRENAAGYAKLCLLQARLCAAESRPEAWIGNHTTALPTADRWHLVVALREALHSAVALPRLRLLIECLDTLAGEQTMYGACVPAAWTCGVAAGLRTALGVVVWPVEQPLVRETRETLRTYLGMNSFEQEYQAGYDCGQAAGMAAERSPWQGDALARATLERIRDVTEVWLSAIPESRMKNRENI